MDNFKLMVAGIGFLLIIIVLLSIFKKPAKNYKLKQFLTKNEKDFFNHLTRIFPDKYICPQVSMGAVIQPYAQMSSQSYQERSQSAILRNKVGSKIIDYLILGKNLEPEFIIELDDNTHNSKTQQDYERDNNLRQAGLATIRVRRNKGRFPDRASFDKILNQ